MNKMGNDDDNERCQSEEADAWLGYGGGGGGARRNLVGWRNEGPETRTARRWKFGDGRAGTGEDIEDIFSHSAEGRSSLPKNALRTAGWSHL